MLKHKRLLAVGLAATLVVAACGGDDDDDSGAADVDCSFADEANAPDGDGLKVGMAFDTGGRGDGTFNDAAGRGADCATEILNVEIDELEAANADDRGPNLRTLAENGNNPIVANGFLFSGVLADIAAEFPDTQFAVTDGFVPDAPENITHLSFAEHEGSFLVGAAAALACECDEIGFIGGQEGALIKRFEAGYTAGAQHINPDLTVRAQYLGPEGDDTAWNSPDKAREIANSWYADGITVIYTAAGGSGAGTREAADESEAWAIGVDSDEYGIAPEEQKDNILTSMLKRVDVAVYSVYETAIDGTLVGGFNVYNLKNEGVDYSKSGGYLEDHYEELDALKTQIIAGDIVVPDSVE